MSIDHDDIHDKIDRKHIELECKQRWLTRVCTGLMVLLLLIAGKLLHLMITRY